MSDLPDSSEPSDSIVFMTSTNIAPIFHPGTYWGSFSYESLWSWEQEELESEGDVVCDDYDSHKFGKALAECATEVFSEERPLESVGVRSIRAVKFGSPREYNFGDDWFELEVEVSPEFLGNIRKLVEDPANRKKVDKYVAYHWKTRDGFISSMPAESYDELLTVFDDLADNPGGYRDEYRMWGSVLAMAWLLSPDGPHDDRDSASGLEVAVLNELRESYELSDFCTVLSQEEVRGLCGSHWHDLDDYLDKLDRQTDAYLSCGVPEGSQDKARHYRQKCRQAADEFMRNQRDLVDSYHSDPFKLQGKLDELWKEWQDKKDNEFPGYWK